MASDWHHSQPLPEFGTPAGNTSGKAANVGPFRGYSDTRDPSFSQGSEQTAGFGPNVSGARRWWSHSVSSFPPISARSTRPDNVMLRQVTRRADVRMRSAADPSRREANPLSSRLTCLGNARVGRPRDSRHFLDHWQPNCWRSDSTDDRANGIRNIAGWRPGYSTRPPLCLISDTS